MKVRVLPSVDCVNDGVSRYVASLTAALRTQGVMLVDDDDYDVLHLLSAHRYDPEWREAKRKGRRLVVTVHDLIPEHFGLSGPQYSGVSERREILKAADVVIAVSQYTKDDIVATYGIPPEKIRVVHNGVDQKKGASGNGSHLLWVGRRAGYKNFFWFVRAVAPLLWKTGWRVVCTGGQAFGRKERLLIALLGLSRRFEVVRADEQQMSRLYREAVCLVMPSRREGFGLPVVEAMGNGCPVVVPHAHVFPEIAGDAAEYYDQDSARSLRDHIRKCVDAEHRRDLVAKGLVQAGRYSWRKCASEVAQCYVK